MGVLNVTPDSFSDGGQFNELTTAIAQARLMVDQGATIIDVGGQSTRPGAVMVSLQEELDRVLPIIQGIREGVRAKGVGQRLLISVDTTRVEVARRAIAAGANWVNDVSGGTYEPQMLELVAALGVPIVLMHLRGTPETMQSLTVYEDVMGEVVAFLRERSERAIAAGVERSKIIVDPGIGFAKTMEQNLVILRELGRLKALGFPVLVGPSRKSFIGKILEQPDPGARVWGTAAACCGAIAAGADILRVHDVLPMRDVCRVADAIWRG